MSARNRLDAVAQATRLLLTNPREGIRRLAEPQDGDRAGSFVDAWTNAGRTQIERATSDPLHAYFDSVTEGPGIWKWLHYFEIYHRHLQKFVGGSVDVVEIGVYSGGSLEMWKQYFGPGCRIHGVDIQPECKAYEDETTSIHIGDQGDRDFWRRFREEVPNIDVVIDDGGHEPEQQMVTLEELLPHLRPGGVFICEDVLRRGNEFTAFTHTLADRLNEYRWDATAADLSSIPTQFQSAIHSMHFYPFVVAIEMREHDLRSLTAPKHGTEWQPFLDGQ